MKENPSRIKGDDLPVDNVSWNDVVKFCSEFGKKYGGSYRLPYEAECEFTCRAGTTTEYYWGDKMNGDYAWYVKNSRDKPHPVGLKKPNAWGLYDMIGNAWEWGMDWDIEEYYQDSPAENPEGPTCGPLGLIYTVKVIRGGAWKFGEEYQRCANRYYSDPSYKIIVILISVIILLSTFILVANSEEDENYPQEMAKVGDTIPLFQFTNVFNKEDSNNYGDEWFFLYCFANYKNFALLLS